MSVADDQSNELDEEEVDEDDDLEEMSDSDEDEVEFDEDDVEEFSHSISEKLFIDSEFRVWNDEQELIGTYNALPILSSK